VALIVPDRGAAVNAAAAAGGTVVGEDGLARPAWASVDPLLRDYYDQEWGLPVTDEQGLYERICLEGFQAGLSWATILRKRPAFRAAFADFNPDTVALFTEADIERLLQDPGIVRNRLKVRSAVTNAQATLALRKEGGLVDFVWQFKPVDTPRPAAHSDIPTQSAESIALSKALRKKGFSFVGPTSMFALMEAIGMVDTHLLDSHRRGSSGIWPGPTSK
jgi:DNA-3-methyladenine glycosylase I